MEVTKRDKILHEWKLQNHVMCEHVHVSRVKIYFHQQRWLFDGVLTTSRVGLFAGSLVWICLPHAVSICFYLAQTATFRHCISRELTLASNGSQGESVCVFESKSNLAILYLLHLLPIQRKTYHTWFLLYVTLTYVYHCEFDFFEWIWIL